MYSKYSSPLTIPTMMWKQVSPLVYTCIPTLYV